MGWACLCSSQAALSCCVTLGNFTASLCLRHLLSEGPAMMPHFRHSHACLLCERQQVHAEAVGADGFTAYTEPMGVGMPVPDTAGVRLDSRSWCPVAALAGLVGELARSLTF